MHLFVFSHLRWDYIFQRPQHIISRFSNMYHVFYVEEPIFTNDTDGYSIRLYDGVIVVIPHLNKISSNDVILRQRDILNKLFQEHQITNYWFWYYSPVAFLFSNHFTPLIKVYDCINDFSALKFALPEFKQAEKQLLQAADIVFAAGPSLHEAKKNYHHNIHCLPDNIDKEHFYKARLSYNDPEDQSFISYPRLGFSGIIHNHVDINLIREVASCKPGWQFIFIGCTMKLDAAKLKPFKNIHLIGMKFYDVLPFYISNWDIAMVPFLDNEHTRSSGATKILEYLAAGKPVISTPSQDVARIYNEKVLINIASTASEFIKCASGILNNKKNKIRIERIDEFLSDISWDNTWEIMNKKIQKALKYQ